MRSFDACIFLLSPKSYLRGEASVAPARWLLARSAQTQSGLPLASAGRKPASFPSAGDGSRRWRSRGPNEPELSNAGAASAAEVCEVCRRSDVRPPSVALSRFLSASRLFFFFSALKMATRESREGPRGELPGAAVPSATSWVAVNHGSVPSHTHFWSCAPEAAVVTGPRAPLRMTGSAPGPTPGRWCVWPQALAPTTRTRRSGPVATATCVSASKCPSPRSASHWAEATQPGVTSSPPDSVQRPYS